jgi:hypothetical protein
MCYGINRGDRRPGGFLKRKIHVSAQVESFLTVSHVVARTDMVATLPEFAARLFAANLPLQILELPFALSDITRFLAQALASGASALFTVSGMTLVGQPTNS